MYWTQTAHNGLKKESSSLFASTFKNHTISAQTKVFKRACKANPRRNFKIFPRSAGYPPLKANRCEGSYCCEAFPTSCPRSAGYVRS